MTMSDQPTPWKKSSRSETNDCVEVSSTSKTVRVRDSKNTSDEIQFERGAFDAFAQAMNAGQ